MSLLQQVETIRNVQHMRLREALTRAEADLRRINETRREAALEVRGVDMFGDPIQGEENEPPRPRSMHALLNAWGPFEDRVLDRLNQWEVKLWPLVRRWSEGEGLGLSVKAVTATLMEERACIDPMLNVVRMESNFIPETRATMVALFAALDVADRAEEEVVPALKAGSMALAHQTATQAPPRVRSGADVARNLRSNRAPEEEEVEEPGGILASFGRLMGWRRR